MNILRIAMIVLAALYILPVALTALISLGPVDADDRWAQMVYAAVHPLGAAALMVLAATRLQSRVLVAPMTALLAVNIVADIAIAAEIALGFTKGDWWLSLAFSIMPAIGLLYTATLRRSA